MLIKIWPKETGQSRAKRKKHMKQNKNAHTRIQHAKKENKKFMIDYHKSHALHKILNTQLMKTNVNDGAAKVYLSAMNMNKKKLRM